MKLGGSKEKTPKLLLGAPPIADMTPPRQREARARRELQRKWTGAVSAIALVTIVAVAAGFTLKLTAESSYKNEVKEQKELVAEIAKYDEVNVAIATTSDIEAKRQLAFASEAAWSDALTRVNKALPQGVELVSFTATGGGNALNQAGSALGFSATISSETPIAYADVLYLFSGIDGISEVKVGDLARDAEGETYTYTVAFGFDNSVLTNRFVPEENLPQEEAEASDEEEK